MTRHKIFALLALCSAAVAPSFVACSSSNDQSTGGSDAGVDSNDALTLEGRARRAELHPRRWRSRHASECLLYPREDDPVGLCIQKAAIRGVHSVLTEAGGPFRLERRHAGPRVRPPMADRRDICGMTSPTVRRCRPMRRVRPCVHRYGDPDDRLEGRSRGDGPPRRSRAGPPPLLRLRRRALPSSPAVRRRPAATRNLPRATRRRSTHARFELRPRDLHDAWFHPLAAAPPRERCR